MIGQFELKTLESAPRAFEFQSQNAWSWGQPSRQIESDDPGGIEFDENAVIRARYALELEMGFTNFLKMRVGIEFEQERLDDPVSIEEGERLRRSEARRMSGPKSSRFSCQRRGDGTGLGVVAEIEGPVDHKGPNNLTLGPIIEFQSGRWVCCDCSDGGVCIWRRSRGERTGRQQVGLRVRGAAHVPVVRKVVAGTRRLRHRRATREYRASLRAGATVRRFRPAPRRARCCITATTSAALGEARQ